MGKHKLREDKKCQNCNAFVRKRFCPRCGQENIETRQPFHYLFTHFIEDLVHYDGSFWKTVKHLLLKPGLLTKEYLDGKRKKYVPPVKLYIFVSFFVFFVGGIISNITSDKSDDAKQDSKPKTENNYQAENTNFTQENNDSLAYAANDSLYTINDSLKTIDSSANDNSVNFSSPVAKNQNGLLKVFFDKINEIQKNYTQEEFLSKAFEMIKNHFQKFLFLYMPVYAFVLWLFHSKKKLYYFDHGIFTLHYFSFLLLSTFILVSILDNLQDLGWFAEFISNIAQIVLLIWIILYFFKAHRKVYGYSRTNTFLRGLLLLFVNSILFLLGILVYSIIILFMI